MHTVRLVEVESGIGMVLPDETLSRLGLRLGQTVFLIETAEGWKLTAREPVKPWEIAPDQVSLANLPDPVGKLAE
ncbi:hypothetical protein ACLIJR_04240 [Hydrogenophaga sp. XSHU_21]